jgi:hypothetical protein
MDRGESSRVPPRISSAREMTRVETLFTLFARGYRTR